MMTEHAGASPGEMSFDDDELGEMVARLAGEVRRPRTLLRVPDDPVPRSALSTVESEQTLAETSGDGSTPTAREKALPATDRIVDEAFDAEAARSPRDAWHPPARPEMPAAESAAAAKPVEPSPEGVRSSDVAEPSAAAPGATRAETSGPNARTLPEVPAARTAVRAATSAPSQPDPAGPAEANARMPQSAPLPPRPRSTPATGTVAAPPPVPQSAVAAVAGSNAARPDAVTREQSNASAPPRPPPSPAAQATAAPAAAAATVPVAAAAPASKAAPPPPPANAAPSAPSGGPAAAAGASPSRPAAPTPPPAAPGAGATPGPPPRPAVPATSPGAAPRPTIPAAGPAPAVTPPSSPALAPPPPPEPTLAASVMAAAVAAAGLPAAAPSSSAAPAPAQAARPASRHSEKQGLVRIPDDAIFCSAPPPDAKLLRFSPGSPLAASIVVSPVTPRNGKAAVPVVMDTSRPSAGPAPLVSDDDEEIEGVELEEVPHRAAAARAGEDKAPRAARSAAPPIPPAAAAGGASAPPSATAVAPAPSGGAPSQAAGSIPPAVVPADGQGGEPEQQGRRKRRGKPWFEEVFDEHYLHTLPHLSAQQTEQEALFICEALKLDSVATLLDVACGHGRHALELAGRGHTVTGLDLSVPLLIKAADAARRAGLNVEFVQGDMRDMSFEGKFDAAYCMQTSFGFFEDEVNRAVAAQIARALKPGALFLLDVINRDYVVGELPARVWWQGEGCMVLEEVDFNYYGSRIQNRRSIVFEDGRKLEQEISVRAYSLHEIGKLLHNAGFRVVEVSGGIQEKGRFFGDRSRQMLIVAEKKA